MSEKLSGLLKFRFQRQPRATNSSQNGASPASSAPEVIPESPVITIEDNTPTSSPVPPDQADQSQATTVSPFATKNNSQNYDQNYDQTLTSPRQYATNSQHTNQTQNYSQNYTQNTQNYTENTTQNHTQNHTPQFDPNSQTSPVFRPNRNSAKQIILDSDEEDDGGNGGEMSQGWMSKQRGMKDGVQQPAKAQNTNRNKRGVISVCSSDEDSLPEHPWGNTQTTDSNLGASQSSTEATESPSPGHKRGRQDSIDLTELTGGPRKRIRMMSDDSDQSKTPKKSQVTVPDNEFDIPEIVCHSGSKSTRAHGSAENVSQLPDKILDDEDEEEEMEDSDDEKETFKQSKAILKFFESATFSELAAMSRCSKKKAEMIISMRPFSSYEDLVTRFTENKVLTFAVINCCWEIIHIRNTVVKLMNRCEKISERLDTVVGNLATQTSCDDREDMCEQPACITEGLELKQYQLIGLTWLKLIYTNEVDGILADEMGLGKTIQAIAFLASLLQEGESGPHIVIVPASTSSLFCIVKPITQGLGKTIQAIAFLASLLQEGESGPHIVIVPASTIENWARELEKWCPSLKVTIYYGSVDERKAVRYGILHDGVVDFHVLLTTYTMATGSTEDRSLMKKCHFHYAVFDEGHLLKNMSTKRYQHLTKIQAERRLLLTGTPLQNNLLELVSLLSFVVPHIFTGKTDQLKKIFTMVTKGNDARGQYEEERITHAKKIMKPFVLRRIKAEVLQSLPKKIEVIKACQMIPDQEELYDKVRDELSRGISQNDLTQGTYQPKLDQEELYDKVRDELSRGISQNDLTQGTYQPKLGLSALMQLRKVANHPLLLRKHYSDADLVTISKKVAKEPSHRDRNAIPEVIREDLEVMSDFEIHKLCCFYPKQLGAHTLMTTLIEDSGKFRMLDSILPKMKKQGDRVLLFSQFKIMMDIIQEYVGLRGMSFLRLDGSTPVADRLRMIDEYNHDTSIFIFMLTTRAGGLGINLATANKVIIHDIDYNPWNDKQAEDRSHRLGQTREVEVIKLISVGTVEEAMLACGFNKLQLEKDVTRTTTSGDDEQIEKQDVTNLLRLALAVQKDSTLSKTIVSGALQNTQDGTSTEYSSDGNIFPNLDLDDTPDSAKNDDVEDSAKNDDVTKNGEDTVKNDVMEVDGSSDVLKNDCHTKMDDVINLEDNTTKFDDVTKHCESPNKISQNSSEATIITSKDSKNSPTCSNNQSEHNQNRSSNSNCSSNNNCSPIKTDTNDNLRDNKNQNQSMEQCVQNVIDIEQIDDDQNDENVNSDKIKKTCDKTTNSPSDGCSYDQSNNCTAFVDLSGDAPILSAHDSDTSDTLPYTGSIPDRSGSLPNLSPNLDNVMKIAEKTTCGISNVNVGDLNSCGTKELVDLCTIDGSSSIQNGDKCLPLESLGGTDKGGKSITGGSRPTNNGVDLVDLCVADSRDKCIPNGEDLVDLCVLDGSTTKHNKPVLSSVDLVDLCDDTDSKLESINHVSSVDLCDEAKVGTVINCEVNQSKVLAINCDNDTNVDRIICDDNDANIATTNHVPSNQHNNDSTDSSSVECISVKPGIVTVTVDSVDSVIDLDESSTDTLAGVEPIIDVSMNGKSPKNNEALATVQHDSGKNPPKNFTLTSPQRNFSQINSNDMMVDLT